MSGRITHFEIPYDDGDRARAFYGEAFGWTTESPPGLDYTFVGTGPVDENGMPTEPGYIGGGMFPRSGESSGPSVVVEVDSIDDALATIERLGGTKLDDRTPVGDMGFASRFRDTEGNVIGLWENA
ncbi:VOC family protein [Rhodococcus rhodnii]|uniref:VOC domain-containing protein n=2 Tax=Rhodococcus rhodnii TaxID=38312 RepID=R7WQL4_9NOCA|nr:VOC family protein [Rhodococcus rhodnii]EOM77570.1 hypothetical protein Rrhod_1075 [Rhodococcus rhodnii LMG 5362]TXG89213.1 VOC family protein [Rhodococcus rhodnii]